MRRLSEDLVCRGHQVTVITTDAIEVDAIWRRDAKHIPAGKEIINGVEVTRMPIQYLPFHGKTMTLLSFLPFSEARYRFSMPGPLPLDFDEITKSAGEFDLVHATALPFTSMIWTASKLAASRKKPFVVTPFMHLGSRERIGYGYRKRYQMELLMKADIVIVQTPIERNALIDLGVQASKIRLLGMGIDTAALPKGDGKAFRERYDLTGPVVFNLSAKTFDKGTFHTVEAMRLLWKRGRKYHLVLAGPERQDFKGYFSSLAKEDRQRIIEFGVVDEQTKADIFDAGDVLCMPSRSESFGLVYLEAWRYGAQVIAARSGAIPDVIRNEVDGLLVPFGDVRAIADAIETALKDKESGTPMMVKGLKRLETEFNWARTFERYEEIIREIFARASSGG